MLLILIYNLELKLIIVKYRKLLVAYAPIRKKPKYEKITLFQHINTYLVYDIWSTIA